MPQIWDARMGSYFCASPKVGQSLPALVSRFQITSGIQVLVLPQCVSDPAPGGGTPAFQFHELVYHHLLRRYTRWFRKKSHFDHVTWRKQLISLGTHVTILTFCESITLKCPEIYH